MSALWRTITEFLKEFLQRSKEPISVFTGLLAFIALLQWCTFVASEQASVIIRKAHFTKEPAVHDPFLAITIEIKNGGKSTATVKLLDAFIGHKLQPEPYYGDVLKGDVKIAVAMAPILPNDTIERRLDFSTAWGQDYITRLNDGTLPLYFWGRIRYRDEFSFFGSMRHTGFCFIYRPTGGVRERIFETCQEPAYTYTR